MNRLLFFLLLGATLTSCQPTKVLQPGELLYTGSKLEYKGEVPGVQEDQLKAEILQDPNTKFLGMPLRLGIYSQYAEKEKGIGKWLRENLGEPPSILQYEEVNTSSLALEKYLIDHGYLQAEVGFDTLVDEQRATVLYHIKAGAPYQLQAVDWPADTNAISTFVQRQRPKSVLIPDQPYRTEDLKAERNRLAGEGREQGFYGLNADNFYYFLDTTSGDHRVKAFLRMAEDPVGRPYTQHYIGRTTVYPLYFLDEEQGLGTMDTLQFGYTRFIQPQTFVRPKVIRKAIIQTHSDLYSMNEQQRSVNRLLGLGAYKFVNLKYELRRFGDTLFLDRKFYLTPSLTQDFSAEVGASTLSTASSSFNLGLSLNYTHRNIFSGSERLNIRFSTDAATQLGKEVDFINSVNLALEGQLSFPDFKVPFNLFRSSQAWQARTNASLRGDFQRRTNFFTLISLNAKYGYEWQPSQLQRYQWNPIQLNRVRVTNTSPEFEQRLQNDPRLRRSFSDYFIASTRFQFDYSEEQPNSRQNYLSTRVALEAAGNLAYGLNEWLASEQDEPYGMFGLPFAQFFRIDGAAQYHHYTTNSEWASRLNIGLAVPYGNSDAIPYVRQFFVGGANSIRAWQIRALGPGATEVEEQDAEIFQDQTGDIKLEANLEYRFPLFSYLKGAVFTDAGNIWLMPKESIELDPATVFHWNRFYRQIAVGTGFGLRLDITYFVLRLDLAWPVRKPYNDAGNRWVFNEIDFGDPGWRQENLVFNLALGYPF